jgi:hypothetical protein
MASALPAPEQADNVFDLLAGWKLDSFLLIRLRMNGRFAPILLQKSFWDDDRNFLGPLMRFV